MVISLGWLSPATSCGLPAAQTTRAGSRCLLGLAPTGGCRAAPVARRAVGSYPTFSPLPFGEKGGLFSVALSVALRRPGVTWQSTLRSSDFPQRTTPAGALRPSRPTATRRETYERSEEHTSELQSPCNLVCRLLLEKKNRPAVCSQTR